MFNIQDYEVTLHTPDGPITLDYFGNIKRFKFEPFAVTITDTAKTRSGEAIVKRLGQRGDRLISEYIANVEKQGQRELIKAAGYLLPVEGSNNPEIADLGIEFGKTYLDFPLFRHASLPDGWKLQADPEHEYWSSIRDQSDAVRAWVFYCAAPHRQKAQIKKGRG